MTCTAHKAIVLLASHGVSIKNHKLWGIVLGEFFEYNSRSSTDNSKRSKFMDTIKIKGAREHNLKNIDVEIPKNKLVVFTGLSGSGKSSLAFDTIYAEGQRRYVESLSAYA